MAISPMAHVALLQTDINSGFRFVPRIGMKLAREERLAQINKHKFKCMKVNRGRLI